MQGCQITNCGGKQPRTRAQSGMQCGLSPAYQLSAFLIQWSPFKFGHTYFCIFFYMFYVCVVYLFVICLSLIDFHLLLDTVCIFIIFESTCRVWCKFRDMRLALICILSAAGKGSWVLDLTELLTKFKDFILNFIFTNLDPYPLMITKRKRGNLAYSFTLIHSSNIIKCIFHARLCQRLDLPNKWKENSCLEEQQNKDFRESNSEENFNWMRPREGRPQLLSFKIQMYLCLTYFFYSDPLSKKTSQRSSTLSSHLVFPWWNSLLTAKHLRLLYILGISLPPNLAFPKTLQMVGYRSILWPASKEALGDRTSSSKNAQGD